MYTQTTDLEIKVNGLLTCDRAILKLDPEVPAAAHHEILGAPIPHRVYGTDPPPAVSGPLTVSNP